MSSIPSAAPDQPVPKPAPIPPAPPVPPAPRAPGTGAKPVEPAVGFTRAGALWASLIMGFLVLILLLIFIAQNTADTPFQFFGWHWSLPLGVGIVLAAVGGGVLTFAVGTARILQLRRAARKHVTAVAPAP